MSYHQTERVVVGEQVADIDVNIAPLIRAMWERGIKTTACLRGHAGTDRLWRSSPMGVRADNYTAAPEPARLTRWGRIPRNCGGRLARSVPYDIRMGTG
jgi:hypothetical protein